MLLLPLLGSVAACASDVEPPTEVPRPLSLLLMPGDVPVGPGSEFRFRTLVDGRDVAPAEFRWSSSDTSLVRVDETGRVSARHRCSAPSVRIDAVWKQDPRVTATAGLTLIGPAWTPKLAGIVRSGTTTPVNPAAASGSVEFQVAVLGPGGCRPESAADIVIVHIPENGFSRQVLTERREVADLVRAEPTVVRLNTLATDASGAPLVPDGRYELAVRFRSASVPLDQLVVGFVVRNR